MSHLLSENAPQITKLRVASPSWLRTLALTSLISTILLIMAGSFVRVSGNGLGCPDWPLCYGRPIPPMQIGAWIEFGHRMLGAIVGFQIASVALLAWRGFRHDKWIFRPAVFAGLLLLIQVSLGGIHVLNELPRWTGVIHTAVAMAILGLLAVVVTSSRDELRQSNLRISHLLTGTAAPFWATIGTVTTYVLLLTGSVVTRTGSSLACPGFPLCGLETISEQIRPFAAIQMVHRLTALIVTITIVIVVWYIIKNAGNDRLFRGLANLLLVLLITQIGLGIINIYLGLPMWSRVLHLGVASSIWALIVIIAVSFNLGKTNVRTQQNSSLISAETI